MENIKPCWYRVSAKWIIFDENNNLLLIADEKWQWDLPWGGIEHNEDIFIALEREIEEEIWVKVKNIDKQPVFFLTEHKPNSKSRKQVANVFYKVELENYDIKTSNECSEWKFCDKETAKNLNTYLKLDNLFDLIF